MLFLGFIFQAESAEYFYHSPACIKPTGMKAYFSLIKFSHTVFALPFALLGFFLAWAHTGVAFSWSLLGLVVLCMVFARSAAMAFNRYLDRDYDRQNPRTQQREIPAGVIHPRAALLFTGLNALFFIATTWFINPLCFYLSPVALLVILGYSFTKRFTALCHFVLGLGLALAPLGAYLAGGGRFDTIPMLYSVTVLLWTAGFDIIYALQDDAFDRSVSLRSIPVRMGRTKALWFSRLLHVLSIFTMLTAGYLLQAAYPARMGGLQVVASVSYIALLGYQHVLVKPNDLSRVNLAFFTMNGLASVLFCGLMVLDILF
jgi:4-hydroxybenzoate polyprenyltransferase